MPNKKYRYNNDSIQVRNGELLINNDFVTFVSREYEFFEALSSYYGMHQNDLLVDLYEVKDVVNK